MASGQVVQNAICHGSWAQQGLECSLGDLLFDTRYAAQLFDWQNAVFLFFMPVMLGIAAFVFGATYSSSGDLKLKDIFDKAGDMNKVYADWGSPVGLPQTVSGENMGNDGIERDSVRTSPEGETEMAMLRATPEGTADPSQIEMGQDEQLRTSSHPTDVDPRNIAVMISLSAFIISIGMVCWAAISDFTNVTDVGTFTSKGIYAQGFATQCTAKGAEHRGVNIGWGFAWLVIGSLLMTVAQFIIRRVVMGPAGLNVVEAVLERGNVAAAICEAGMQIAMGMVVAASISGPPSHFGYDLAACLLFYVLALILLVLWSFLFDKMTVAWDTWQEIGRGNVAAAVSQFTQMVCTGLLLSNAIYKTFELSTFFAWFVTGSVVRMLFRVVMDYCLIAPRFVNPRYTSTELHIDTLILKGNWGAATAVGALQVILTHVVNAFLPDSCKPFVYADGRTTLQMSLGEKLAGTDYLGVIWRWDRFVALAIIFGTFLLARIPYDMRLLLRSRLAKRRGQAPLDPDLNFYIVEHRKHAVTISFGGYLVAVGQMLVGVFRDANYETSFVDSSDPQAWGYLFLQIAVGYFMLVVALLISDVFVLHKFDNLQMMMQYDNRAVALIEAGSLIGSSFTVAAVINGWDYSEPPYASAAIFFFGTQLLFVVFQLIFEAVTPYDDEKEVELGNAAAGLNNGLNLVAVGMLLGRSAYLSHSLIMLVCWALVTYPLIFLFRYVTDRIVLPSISLEATIECLDRLRPDVFHPRRPSSQGNWGTALVAGAVTISLAQLLNTFLRDCPFDLGVPIIKAA